MKFIEAVTTIIEKAQMPLSPVEIREQIKNDFPEFYDTEVHKGKVERGTCKSLDHALTLQVYNLAGSDRIICDRSARPMRFSVVSESLSTNEDEIDIISEQSIEEGVGILYILKTRTFTDTGKEIIKIGITSGDIEKRISQLYTTGVPYRFEVYATYTLSGFIEIEKALHCLLSRYRINTSREFFSEDALPFINRIISLFDEIEKA
jgi:hypothetical protein